MNNTPAKLATSDPTQKKLEKNCDLTIEDNHVLKKKITKRSQKAENTKQKLIQENLKNKEDQNCKKKIPRGTAVQLVYQTPAISIVARGGFLIKAAHIGDTVEVVRRRGKKKIVTQGKLISNSRVLISETT